ncbi:MAG TPA: OB-fold nucleic acid binding domain-containing protein, partial [Desulfotignum sp.]|nr:OB-fold nucleic acid binding domain-containing protein [Desulfotignum sp.]
MNFDQRRYCGSLNMDHTGRQVLLAGWVDALRDHGEILFIHLRDRTGIVQVVFDPEKAEAPVCETAAALRGEHCIRVTGTVI